MNDEIHVKLSGSAVYRAVKNYLDNSEELKTELAKLVAKHLEPAVKNKIESMINNLYYETRTKINAELDKTVRKEVETRVAEHISKGLKKLFEGSDGHT